MAVTVRGVYVEPFRYQGTDAPLHERGEVQEPHYPWRYGTGRLVRLPLTRIGLAVGRWEGSRAAEDDDGPLVSMRAVAWEEMADGAAERADAVEEG